MTSLINTVRSKYLEAIRSVETPQRWKVLVVDEHSQRLINTVLKQYDILEENITLIEVIANHREPQSLEAVYILMPTTENVQRIIRDFTPDNEKYSAAHLFFTDPIPDQLLAELGSSPAERHLKGVKDLYLNFWPIETQAFSLKLPEQFFSLYSPPKTNNAFKGSRERLEEDIKFTSKMIANVCISLNEFPYIRYYMPSHHEPLGALKPNEQTRAAPPPTDAASRWRTNLARGAQARAYEEADTDFCTKLLAFQVQGLLDEYKKQNPTFPKSDQPRPRGTLLITDRAMDALAPFIHEFTYQAMSNDLLPIEDGTRYSYKFQTAVGAYEDTTVTLSDADTVYTEVRHMHMREAIDKLIGDFNDFLKEHAGFKGDNVASLNDMKDMLASLPQYQEQREKVACFYSRFSLHLNMAQECMGIFARDKLTELANVEQNCATGLTPEGKVPKHLVEEMVPLLDSREVVNWNKVRIIALYIQHRDGVPDEDRRRLFQHARLSLAEQDAISALTYLGVRITRGPNDRDTRKRLKQRSSDEDGYELSRYKPLLRTVLEDHVNGRLDQQAFPYVKDSPTGLTSSSSLRNSPASPTTPKSGSLRSAKPSWHKAAPKTGTTVEIRQRVLVFVAGGMTYSEMREAYLLSKSLNKDIIIGSTHTITPKYFMEDMRSLELAGVGSRAIPNGLRSGPGQRPFQQFYDEKYFTRDQTPSKPQPQPVPQQSSGKGSGRKVLARPGMPPQMSSSLSQGSGTEDKKKKKRFF
ncbi:Sec1-like snare protein [Thelephora ganbajun]|uniref:Sec1-like snare protein n=1 Tax=Thelephora ganbajun TaxID=370292 RepID=A0ACB6ZCE0_THEGA|nr:Sec1-like snare protein [Thelephora ganbajun]